MSWECKRCGEVIEDNFDACFSCGSSREGEADPGFHKQIDDPLKRIHAEQVASFPSNEPPKPRSQRLVDEIAQSIKEQEEANEYRRVKPVSAEAVAFGVVSLALGLTGFTVAPLTFGVAAILFGLIAVICRAKTGYAGMVLGVLNIVWVFVLIEILGKLKTILDK